MKEKFHIIYIIIILIFAGTTIWWVDHSNKHDNAAEHYVQHVKDYPLLDPALPFYEKKNLIVNVQELRKYLKSLPEQNKDWAEMSIYFEVMNTGASVAVNNDVQVWPSSLTKLPLSMVTMKKIEAGEWDMNTKFKMIAEDADDLTTPGVSEQVGQSFDVKFLLERLLKESDNTAYAILLRQIEPHELATITDAVGIEQLFTAEGKMSAKEYTRLLRALYTATYLNNENSEFLLDLLQKSDFKNFIKGGLPTGAKFAHKWGLNLTQNVYSDSGIIYIENRPVMISVMIQGKNSGLGADEVKADRLMKEIGTRVYEFIKKQ